ncbi:hypothetical protein TRAPUB_11349 [Trametes pubescens]|uniref:F-box domain-containing protein n=1 Tax=Trametes pubescens TaxID=154538 RepID=A0A1M2VWY7_TRAPU|nr:hypothetical protein TRAPUB_11349 [Trametes pubescens]
MAIWMDFFCQPAHSLNFLEGQASDLVPRCELCALALQEEGGALTRLSTRSWRPQLCPHPAQHDTSRTDSKDIVSNLRRDPTVTVHVVPVEASRNIVLDPYLDESQLPGIHNVPIELTIRIFALVTALENGLCEGWFPTTGVAKLMLVCRHWRNIALSTPSFWRHIDGTRPLRWISLCLERSQGCTLEVSLTLDRQVDPADMLNLVMPHARRIASLYANLSMERGHYWHILRPLFAADMPALERLELVPLRDWDDLRYARQKTWDFGICRAKMPYLRWLSVEQVILPSPRDFWQALRVLKLYGYPSACSIPRSIDDLVDVLARNPQLEELHIRLYTILGEKSIRIPTMLDQGSARRRQPVARVHLPLLHTCSLHAYNEFVEELLCRLELPEDILDVRTIPAPR